MYIHSHFGVYGVVRKDGLLLVIKKARGPYTGMWALPGGSPEPLELLEQTLVREFEEEVGLTPKAFKQIKTTSTIYNYAKDAEKATLRHIGVLYTVEIEGKIKTTADGLDSNGCCWVALSQLTKENAEPFVLEAARLT